jgi:two-component system response regulator AlgR
MSDEGGLRVFIVDDEAPARSRLRVLLADLQSELANRLVGEAENGAAALAALETVAADVVLVDIRMPVMDGIELAQHVQRIKPPPAVVFVTAYDQYAVQAFELAAVDYLLKPVRAQRLKAALDKARRSQGIAPGLARALAPAGRRHLSCVERGRVLLVAVADIVYLKAELKYVTACTRERCYLLEESLTALEEEFGPRFVRVHRNCLVARAAVAGFERVHAGDGDGHWQVLLKGMDERLDVSRRQWPLLKATLAEAARAER